MNYKNNSSKLTLTSVITLLICLLLFVLIILDSPLSWVLFPGDTVLLAPLLLFIPLLLSFFSLKKNRSVLAKLIFGISILLLIFSGIIAIYIVALGSAWTI